MDKKQIIDEVVTRLEQDIIEDHSSTAAFISHEAYKKKMTYIPCPEHAVFKYLEEAKKLCTEYSNLMSMNTNIGVTFVGDNISNNVYAHIIKPSRLLKHFAGYDLIIEISAEFYNLMTTREKLALLVHELTHIMFKEKRNGDLELMLVKHDLMDFHSIIETFGLYYIRNLVD